MKSFLLDLGYCSLSDLTESIFPSLRHSKTILIAMLAILSGIIEPLFGFNHLIFVCFLVALVAELSSGLLASKLDGMPFESGKMFRFTFKLFFSLTCVYILWQFAIYFKEKESMLAYAFNTAHSGFLAHMAGEYLVSISENVDRITKDKKSSLSKFINSLTQKILNRGKGQSQP